MTSLFGSRCHFWGSVWEDGKGGAVLCIRMGHLFQYLRLQSTAPFPPLPHYVCVSLKATVLGEQRACSASAVHGIRGVLRLDMNT